MSIRFITNEELFYQVIEPVQKATSFVWIGMADIKDLHVPFRGTVHSFHSVLDNLVKKIVTFDTFTMGLLKHHVSALLEFDVTENRKRLHDLRREGINISFNAWLIKVISNVLDMHPEASAYLYNKKKLILFKDINISIMLEKKIENKIKIREILNMTVLVDHDIIDGAPMVRF